MVLQTHHWHRIGCIGTLLLSACETMQCLDRASLEQLLGQGLSLAEIGKRFGRHEATVAYWVKKHELQTANHEKHVARGGVSRDDLDQLIHQGMSIAQVARLSNAAREPCGTG